MSKDCFGKANVFGQKKFYYKFYIIYFLKRVILEQLIVFIYNQQTELMDFSLDVPVSVLDRIQDTFFVGHSWGVPYL